MRITTRGRYALRAALAMTKLGANGEPVSVNTLAEVEGVSAVFLEQIFYRLKKGGIVRSVRGPGGGFRFARPLEEITVAQILQAAGEEPFAASCDRQAVENCKHAGACLSHHVWAELARIVSDYLSGVTLASIKDAGVL